MLALVTRRFRVPLLWILLDHPGNSDTAQRKELLQRYLDIFGAHSIKLLLADREFIGTEWMKYLNKNNIPFAIRIKSGQRITLRNQRTWSFNTLLRGKRGKTVIQVWDGWLQGMENTPETRLNFAAKQLKTGEWLIIATNQPDPKVALRDYKKRWAIECLFGDAKPRGFNLEDKHYLRGQFTASTALSEKGPSAVDHPSKKGR